MHTTQRALVLVALLVLLVPVASATEHVQHVHYTTEFDPYIPVILWGGLFLLFLWLNAWLPGIAALAALASTFTSPPIWSLTASVMLVAVTAGIHSLLVNGLVPVPWRKKE